MSPGVERFNIISHLIGAILAVAGGVFVLIEASEAGGTRRMTALATYAALLPMVFIASTLYHSVSAEKRPHFRVFDRCAIYLLIAGTYTPFTLVTLHGPWGWSLFVTIWLLALAGVAKDLFFSHRYRGVSVGLYVVMGWLVVLAFEPMQRIIPRSGIALLLAGGIIYTAGVTFYRMGKRDYRWHGVWHICVLSGSACHWLVVLRHIAQS